MKDCPDSYENMDRKAAFEEAVLFTGNQVTEMKKSKGKGRKSRSPVVKHRYQSIFCTIFSRKVL